MTILFGTPQLKWDQPKTYQFWQSPIVKIYEWLCKLILKLTQLFIQIGPKRSQIQTIPGWFRLRIKKFSVQSDIKANSAQLSWSSG